MKGLTQLKEDFQAIYDIAFNESLTETQRLARIKAKLKEALEPLSGDAAMEAAKQAAIKRLENDKSKGGPL